METLVKIARALFPLTFLMYVGLHLAKADLGATFVPDWLPFPLLINYLTGACILAFIISALVGKLDRLAALLMALYVFIVAFAVHLPRATGALPAMGNPEQEMLNIFRNLMTAAALVLYAHYVARDRYLPGTRRVVATAHG